MRFLQLSDLHLRTDHLLYGLDPQHRLRCVLEAALRHESPDFIVITGDLVDCGCRDLQAYAELQGMLEATRLPVFVTAGNHDVTLPPGFASRAPAHSAQLCPGVYSGPVLETDDAFCLFTNTAVEHSAAGQMPATTLAQIGIYASRAVKEHKALLIFGHHPPFVSGYEPMDSVCLRNARALVTTLRDSRHSSDQSPIPPLPFAGYFCGHLHRSISVMLDNLPCWSAPSIVYSLDPYCRTNAVSGTNGDPGYLRVTVTADTCTCECVFVSRRVHRFPIPFIPFDKESESNSEGALNAVIPNQFLRIENA